MNVELYCQGTDDMGNAISCLEDNTNVLDAIGGLDGYDSYLIAIDGDPVIHNGALLLSDL